MKRVLAVVAVVIVVWVAFWIASLMVRSAVRSGDESHAWPAGLGNLSEVPDRYPSTGMSRGAAQLVALSQPLGVDIAPLDRETPRGRTPMEFVRQQLSDWVVEQLAKPDAAIDPLPSESGEYLAGRAADITAVQQLLLSGEIITWAENIDDDLRPMPNLLGHMSLHRVLIGRALDRGRVGDRGGWDDLQAAWKLSESLTRRHELISNLIALAIARNVFAAARKMPLPVPQWFAEVKPDELRRAVLGAMQADAWHMNDRVYVEMTSDGPPAARRVMDAVMAPYTRLAAADLARQRREIADEIAAMRNCVLNGPRSEPAWWNVPARNVETPNLNAMWQRVLRLTPEYEATVRALALRAGSPPQPQSACADGRWIYEENGFRFSEEIRVNPNPEFEIPLAFSSGAGQ